MKYVFIYLFIYVVQFQVEELIKEVQVLREELRSRDKTIAQLTLQCQQLQQKHQREQMVSWFELDRQVKSLKKQLYREKIYFKCIHSVQ